MTKVYFSICTISLLSSVSYLYGGAENSFVKTSPKSVRAMAYESLPSDAGMHHRTKWSNGVFIYIDDDPGAPSLYVFDRSGHVKFSAMIQIPDAGGVRVDDFAAAPDGTVWTAGHATSSIGQRSFFIAHITNGGDDIRVVQTPSYRPCHITVAPDGTVWTTGYGVSRNTNGATKVDLSQNVLRHFDASGKMIASAIPGSTVGLKRAFLGYLAANQDRIGWYSPTYGPGAYIEFSPDMKVLHSYPVAPAMVNDEMEGFVLTPSEHTLIAIAHSSEDGRPPVLYELDRSANKWIPCDSLRDAHGNIRWLEGNDGESLIFEGPPDKSKLQVFDVSQLVSR